MGLINRLLGKRGANVRTHALAMVLLQDQAPPDPVQVIASLRREWSDAPAILDLQTKESTSVASIPGGVLGMAHVSAPVPAGDLDGPVKLAWHWPAAKEMVPKHVGHVICHASSDRLDRLDLRLFHTRLVAAVTSLASSTGVYVGEALLVRNASDYQADARASSRSVLPILSWVGFNPVGGGPGRSAYTTGLTSFGLLELEVHDTRLEWGDLLGQLADIANYEISHGVQIGDGETLGASAEERIAVTHRPSKFIPDLTVARIGV